MKSKLYIAAFASLFTLGLASCSSSSDSDEPIVGPSSIKLEKNEVRVQLMPETPNEGGEVKQSIEKVAILEGNGDYTVFSLNEKLAVAHYDAESNSVVIEGKSVGFVRIMVIDGQVESTAISAMVYNYPRIALENDVNSLDLTIYNKKPVATSYKIVEGNGNYKVSIDKRGVVDAGVNQYGEFYVIPINAENEESRTAVVTITDECGFVLNVDVKVQNSYKPYSVEELDAILKIDTPTVLFAGYKANNEYEYINEKEGDLTVFGAVSEDYYSDDLLGLRLYVPGEIKKGQIKGVQIDYDEFGDMDTSSGKKDVMYFEIVDVNDKYVVAVFSATKGRNNENLVAGYFVLERTEDQLPAQEEK